jgi:hypothetical protein
MALPTVGVDLLNATKMAEAAAAAAAAGAGATNSRRIHCQEQNGPTS